MAETTLASHKSRRFRFKKFSELNRMSGEKVAPFLERATMDLFEKPATTGQLRVVNAVAYQVMKLAYH